MMGALPAAFLNVNELSQLPKLFILAVPVAWIAWTVTREEIFRDVREYCNEKSHHCRSVLARRFFYLFTCEYCFSHWVALGLQFLFQFRLVFDDWRGYLVAFAALVGVANAYMSLYHRLRVDIRRDRALADHTEVEVAKRRAA
jgi:hypothetical protein